MKVVTVMSNWPFADLQNLIIDSKGIVYYSIGRFVEALSPKKNEQAPAQWSVSLVTLSIGVC